MSLAGSVPSRALTILLAATLGCGAPADTPLGQAVAAGDVALVHRLLGAGASPNEIDGIGYTPLIRAAREGNADVARLLLGEGADANLRDAGTREWPPLVHAIHHDRNAVVRALLEAGAEVDAECGGGATPLFYAAAYGNAETVKALLDRGADPRKRIRPGLTPLDNAMGFGGLFDFTDGPPIGTCHPDTVAALLARDPELRFRAGGLTRFSRALGRDDGCDEAFALLRSGTRATSDH